MVVFIKLFSDIILVVYEKHIVAIDEGFGYIEKSQ